MRVRDSRFATNHAPTPRATEDSSIDFVVNTALKFSHPYPSLALKCPAGEGARGCPAIAILALLFESELNRTNRVRQRPTVCRVAPTTSAISPYSYRSQGPTHARCARAGAGVGRRAHCCNVSLQRSRPPDRVEAA